jgi:hypothetical protein
MTQRILTRAMWWGGLGLLFGAGLVAGLALAQPAEAGDGPTIGERCATVRPEMRKPCESAVRTPLDPAAWWDYAVLDELPRLPPDGGANADPLGELARPY